MLINFKDNHDFCFTKDLETKRHAAKTIEGKKWKINWIKWKKENVVVLKSFSYEALSDEALFAQA